MAVKQINRREIRLEKKGRMRRKSLGTAERPRLAVFRSLKHLYVQLIDDNAQKTLLTVSTLSKDLQDEVSKAKSRIEVAKLIGMAVAKQAKEKNFTTVKFDRSGYLYHGLIKSLAEGAREGGLVF
jgi:large subunit ribosomal protein L18